MPKDETKHRNGRRKTRIMTPEEAKTGKLSHWEELEITGKLLCCSAPVIILQI